MHQTWENGKKINLGSDFSQFDPNSGSIFFFFFSWILPLLHVRHCRQLSLYVTSKKTNEPNLRKLQKKKVLGPHLAHLAYQALDIMVSDHHVQHQKKLMIQSWEKFVTDGRIDGQMDESGFIGHCPTNVKRPKIYFNFIRTFEHYTLPLSGGSSSP